MFLLTGMFVQQSSSLCISSIVCHSMSDYCVPDTIRFKEAMVTKACCELLLCEDKIVISVN